MKSDLLIQQTKKDEGVAKKAKGEYKHKKRV